MNNDTLPDQGAPSSPAVKPVKELTPRQITAQRSQKTWEFSAHGIIPDPKLREAYLHQQRNFYGTVTLACSDVEAYDVFSVTRGSDTLLLLAMGIRTREEAVQELEKHDLTYLVEDNEELAQECMRRGIPSYPAIRMAACYGTKDKDEPEYMDALEANGIRSLREMIRYYPTVPDFIMRGVISFADIKEIGVTHVVKAGRYGGSIIRQLQNLKSGRSSYDLETMKKIVLKTEDEPMLSPLSDPLSMAQIYGAEVVLGLYNFSQAADFQRNFLTNEFTAQQRGEMIALNDKLCMYYGRLEYEDIAYLYKHGVSFEEAREGLRNNLPLTQIAGLANDISSSVSSGWL